MTSSLFGCIDPLATLDPGRGLALSQSKGFSRELAFGVMELIRRLRSRLVHVEVTGRTSRGHGMEVRPGIYPKGGKDSSPGPDGQGTGRWTQSGHRLSRGD